MADLTAFAHKSFDPTAWINSAIKDVSTTDNNNNSAAAASGTTAVSGTNSLESYITSLSTKLHIMSQDYTDQLETAMVESMSIMPRLISEIAKTEEQLRSIEQEMKNLTVQLNSFDQRNVVGVEDLSRLDTLKCNMEKCKATLEEHARWSQLVREAKTLLEGGGRLSDSADRIETMFKSLDILKNLPGNEEREETCEAFSSSLLTALRPVVTKEVYGLDVSPLQEYLYVFRKLGRDSEFEELYVRARPDYLRLVWKEYSEQDRSSAGDFIKWLSGYLSKVTKLLAEEGRNTTTLFGVDRASQVMNSMLVEALVPFHQFIGKRLELLGNVPAVTVSTYNLLGEFAKHVVHILKAAKSESNHIRALKAIFGGCIDYAPLYVSSEDASLQQRLKQSLNAVVFAMRDSSGSLDDELFGDSSMEVSSADVYSLYCEKLLHLCDVFHSYFEEVLFRASVYNGGIHIKSVVRSLVAAMNSLIRQLIVKIDDLSVASGFQREYASEQLDGRTDGALASDAAFLSAETSSSSSIAEKLAQKLDLNDLDSRVLIATALKALQAVGRFQKQFLRVEALTRETLATLQQSLLTPPRPISAAIESFSPLLQQLSGQQQQQQQPLGHLGELYSVHVLHGDDNALLELKAFLNTSSSSSRTASSSVQQQLSLSAAQPSLLKLRSVTASLLFRLCLEAPEKMLASLSSEDVWQSTVNEELSSSSSSSVATDDDAAAVLERICEHLLPQSVISQVGEHMLSLVQELESFASSDALSDLLKLHGESRLLPGTSKGWRRIKELLNINDEHVESICSRSKCMSFVATIETTLLGSSEYAAGMYDDYDADSVDASSSRGSADEGEASAETTDDPSHILKFVNEWLGSIFDAIVGLLLAEVSDIAVLSIVGCAQLLTDLEYLSNVSNAMGLHAHPLLSHVRLLLLQDPRTLYKAIEALQPIASKGPVGHLLKFDNALIQAIAKGNNCLQSIAS